MAKIKLGNTKFEELAGILNFEPEQLEEKRARLFPIGNTNDENQTTSIFLASLAAVKEYRELLLSQIGITKVTNRNVSIHVYTEVFNEEQTDRPDGMIVLTSGKKDPVIDWICFVECKVKNNPLETEQVERYIEYGKNVGIDAVITISNQITTSPFELPFTTRKRAELYHWSWTYLKVMSTWLLRTDSVSDEDHVFILSELRRYFDAHRGINNFTNMGSAWKDAVQLIHEHNDNRKLPTEAVNDVINAYKQEEMDVALQMTDKTPYFVHLHLKNNEDRSETLRQELESSKTMTSPFYIDNNKHHAFDVVVNLNQKAISCSCMVEIDKGKAQGQTSTLLKMLEPAGSNENIMITALYNRNKADASQSLATLYAEKNKQLPYSILNKDYGDTVKHFNISIRKEIARDMTGTRNFIDQLESLCDTFLRQVVRYVLLGEK